MVPHLSDKIEIFRTYVWVGNIVCVDMMILLGEPVQTLVYVCCNDDPVAQKRLIVPTTLTLSRCSDGLVVMIGD